MRKEQILNIYEDNGLYGAKNQNGQIVIAAQYTQMNPFSCGLSLVRNCQYQYAYIDYDNNIVRLAAWHRSSIPSRGQYGPLKQTVGS